MCWTWFQHTAARRRLVTRCCMAGAVAGFNTQPPEGGCWTSPSASRASRSFNTQPPEGGCRYSLKTHLYIGSFNTQPPEGGWPTEDIWQNPTRVSTHSRPKAAEDMIYCLHSFQKFQHTAARRRLVAEAPNRPVSKVSTHSRPKAAAWRNNLIPPYSNVSTHSRPKAAVGNMDTDLKDFIVSTHSRPKAAGGLCPSC